MHTITILILFAAQLYTVYGIPINCESKANLEAVCLNLCSLLHSFKQVNYPVNGMFVVVCVTFSCQ